MEKASICAPRVDAPDADGDRGPDLHNCLRAVASALPNHELRERFKLLIQALAASDGVAAQRRVSSEVAKSAESATGRVYSFGLFRLLPSRRLLLEGNRKVEIGSRAFDILTILVQRAGEVVSKNELIGRAWPNIFVHDGNLKTQVSALRRILGEGETGTRYIVTIPRRGYNFVAPISVAAELAPVAPGAQKIPLRFQLRRIEPQRVAQLPWPTNMFGEPATIAELQAGVVQLSECREFQRRRANDSSPLVHVAAACLHGAPARSNPAARSSRDAAASRSEAARRQGLRDSRTKGDSK
jgi:DNA-binding winged helix-turn-helix (wHTH) protein